MMQVNRTRLTSLERLEPHPQAITPDRAQGLLDIHRGFKVYRAVRQLTHGFWRFGFLRGDGTMIVTVGSSSESGLGFKLAASSSSVGHQSGSSNSSADCF
jgi:hypothetical protein